MARTPRKTWYKRALLLLLALAACFPLSGEVNAAYTSNAKLRNQFLTKEWVFSVHIIDEFDPGDPYGGKTVSARNNGDRPAFVRILVHPVAVSSGEPLDVQFGRDLETDMVLRDATHPTALWAKDEFGYYYYLRPIAPGDSAPPLFTDVQIASTVSADLDGSKLRIQVQSEAVAAWTYAYRTAWFASPTAKQAQIKAWLDAEN